MIWRINKVGKKKMSITIVIETRAKITGVRTKTRSNKTTKIRAKNETRATNKSII